MSSQPIGDVVHVTILTTQAPPRTRGFGLGLLLGKATTLPLEQRTREYAKIDDVLVDFPSNTQEYIGAQRYFGQTPAPKKLIIGRQFLAAQSGKLIGGQVSDVVADWTGITNGGFDIYIDGVLRQIHSINCGSATTMANVATAIQTRLQAALASTLCAWDAAKKWFTITSPTTGATSIVLFATAPTGGSSPTDNSATFGFASAQATSVKGIAIETVTDAISASAKANTSWFAFGLTTAMTTQETKDAMAYAEAAKKKFFYTTADANAKTTGNTTNLGYYAKNLGYSFTFGQYSSLDPYASMSAMARELIVDYDQPNSVITLKFKQEPGVAIEPLESADITALKSYNLNYLVDRGGYPMIEEGVVANGRFSDEVTGLQWYQSVMETEVFTVMATIPGRIAQTDEDCAKLRHAMDTAGNRARRAGLFAPNVWRGDGIGERKSGDYLDDGFYSYVQPVSEQSQSDREARVAPAMTQLVCGAGAIHSANVQVNFQR